MASASQARAGTTEWLRSQSIPALVFFTLFVLFAFWYYEGNNFTESNIPVTYFADNTGKSNVLYLHSDHTYEQGVEANGQQQRASGKWRLMGNANAHILFEGRFLNAPAAAVGRDDHYAFGLFHNLFGYLTLTLQSDSAPLIFHKKHLFF